MKEGGREGEIRGNMVRKKDLVAYTEHHGEGILEFHVTDPSHAISARECFTAALLIAATVTRAHTS